MDPVAPLSSRVAPEVTPEVIPEVTPKQTTPVQTTPHDPRPRRRPRRHGPGRQLIVVAVALAALLGVLAWRLVGTGPDPLTRADVDRAVAAALKRAAAEQRAAPPDAARAYRMILPSLVAVASGGGDFTAPTGDTSLGTGVVVNEQGAVLTALHVVADGGPVQVLFTDGTRATARVVTRRPASDIAVLVPDRLPQVVVPAVLGGAVGVGDEVFPVGNPLGLRSSLSAGVVSATGRNISIGTGRTIPGLIQFDAAVNPGNSGGPLLDRDGQVVGIVTALANPSEQPFFVGIGFAVPIGTASGAAGGPQQ